MQKQIQASSTKANLAALVTFIGIIAVIMLIAVMNAPTKGGPQVMATAGTYLAEVKRTALPFLGIVGAGAIALGGWAAITVRRVWPKVRQRRELITAYGFLTPYLLITMTFTVGVLLFSLYISFTSYNIFTPPVWIGLQNYVHAFMGFVDPTQKAFIQSLYNVIWYSIIVVPTQTVFAILLAVILNAPLRFRQLWRTIFYTPSVTSSVVITLIFIWMYQRAGYINFFVAKFLGVFGLSWAGITWLGDPRGLIELIVNAFGGTISYNQWYLKGPSIAWMAIMVQNIFTTIPTFMIMFLAALQDINPVLVEAASIDGANAWQRFRHITLPLLRPIILLVIVLGTIGTLQVFDQVYLATQGGPLGTSTTPVYLIYTTALGTTGPIAMGYALAMAFVLAVIIFIFTYIQRRVLESGTQMF
jgi:multiple sugar transport system permease protein